MTPAQVESKSYTFDEFIHWYPEDSERRYELHDGNIIEMPKPRGQHSTLTGFLIEQLLITIRAMGQGGRWMIPRESILKPPGRNSGYDPDIIVLDQSALALEPRWESESIIQNSDSVQLIVEVVSTNWRDDYYTKFRDYEEMGVQEYWILDYAALGPRKLIGDPKQPTLFICPLVRGEYQIIPFRADTPLASPTFPRFSPSAQQIFTLTPWGPFPVS